MLSNFEHDILVEQINIFVGQAANYLSEMIDRKIVLSIPEVKLVNRQKMSVLEVVHQLNGYLLSSSIEFGASLKGKAQLIFETTKVKRLIAMCMGEAFIEGSQFDDFVDNDLDVTREIGNIILNAIVGGFANLLNIKVTFDIPDITFLEDKELQKSADIGEHSYLLVMDLVFSVANTDIDGLIMCALNIESIESLKLQLQEMGAGFED